MPNCDSCSEPISDSARFCPSCGSVQATHDSPTVDRESFERDAATMHKGDEPLSEDSPTVHRESPPERPQTPTPAVATPRPPSTPSTPSLSSSSSGSYAHGRFLPGQLLGNRYRIVALLGRGGMGEVYRADDLTLGQPVALKFLPIELARHPERLERFRSEVRLARQVSHPHVCRVYDIGEIDGEHFISMEYIEGEDLGNLLKRIGQLPEAKAIQIARQISGGLAAAHDQGLIHRDLKPANIMLDDRGMVRVTDFGLAGTAEDFHRGNVREGTPQYMAPEQLRGESVSSKSDIYSLGLVMYELFTGKKAFEAATLAKLIELREQSDASSLSGTMSTLDPAVERVILHCIEEEPARRPVSALAVSAALPGGDPLAAAIAAGETPSPEMVAAAGDEGLIRPRVAVAMFVVLLVFCALSPLVGNWSGAVVDQQIEHPPAVMQTKAREMLERLGYDAKPADTKGGYFYQTSWLNYIEENDDSLDRWKRLDDPAVPVFAYWYRESPRPLVHYGFFTGISDVKATWGAPNNNLTGMVRQAISSDGRLIYLEVYPLQFDQEATETGGDFDWTPLLREAGLEPADLEPVEPEWVPPVFAHQRAAWTVTTDGDDPITLRFEAARYGKRPVYFNVIYPWTKPTRMEPRQQSVAQVISMAVQILIFVTIIGGSLFLARRNIRMGRGDKKGANRIATFMFAVMILIWLFGSDHVATFSEFGFFIIGLSWSLLLASIVWVLYVALEPWIRRRWPTMLITWSRVLSGKLRDPLVGRDLLIGAAAGSLVAMLVPHGINLVEALRGNPLPIARMFHLNALDSGRVFLGTVLGEVPVAVASGFVVAFFILGLRLLLRREWMTLVAAVLFFGTVSTLGSEATILAGFFYVSIWFLIIFIMLRMGLFAATVTLFCANVIDYTASMPGSIASWSGFVELGAIAILLFIGIWGFVHALAGRPLVSAELLEGS